MTPRPGAIRILGLLLASARRRAVGRRTRARQLSLMRSFGRSKGWGGFGVLLSALVSLSLSLSAAFSVHELAVAGQHVVAAQTIPIAEADDRIPVSDDFRQMAVNARDDAIDQSSPWAEVDTALRNRYRIEAKQIARRNGGDPDDIERRLRASVLRLIPRVPIFGLRSPTAYTGYPALLTTLVLAAWLVMLVLGGEGPEMDVQRRRHPMLEWLLTHPIGLGPVFVAEMLAPLAANPQFWSAPLVPWVLYSQVYDPLRGALAAVLVGVPVAVAASCMGKALEIGIVLRLTMRARGGVAGLMGWMSGLAGAPLLFGWYSDPIAQALGEPLRPLARLPWPGPGLMLGFRDGGFSFGAGVLACSVASGAVIAGSVACAVWSARRGLTAPPESRALVSSRFLARPMRFGRDPLYRKELLWFARDRGALVQAVLIPATVAGWQLFNFRDLIADAGDAWNAWCSGAIVLGTGFLTVLGPRSLASEGAALWLALTWPRGLESLLKAKARMWAGLSSAIVGLALAGVVWRFPADWAQVGLVGVGWVLFARSMAQKTVTLAAVQGPSGEVEKIPIGRRWAVYLGTLTFVTGVLTAQWQVAVVGIVYSTLTAAAMWQNFRARLPYLYDPWSARVPPPPTLMHAMIAITLLVEVGAVITGITLGLVGRQWVGIAGAVGYGLAALGVATGVAVFLDGRSVPAEAIWRWDCSPIRGWLAAPGWLGMLAALVAAALLGGGLGLLAHGYLTVLREFDSVRQLLDLADERMRSVPHLRGSYLFLAVFMAPFAEEYLFRGLLYRALDREWGGWRAVAGSAAFFAIYHPALAWLPVGALGAVNAVLFKKTGRLEPAVLLHMIYNGVVLA